MFTRALLATTALLAVSTLAPAYAAGIVQGVNPDGSPAPVAIQNGNNNVAQIEQITAYEGVAEATQDGSDNMLIIKQDIVSNSGVRPYGKDVKASAFQRGSNGATLIQSGQQDSSIISRQEGTLNVVEARQGDPENGVNSMDAYNNAENEQRGNANSASIRQHGRGNDARNYQGGDNNVTIIEQESTATGFRAFPNFAGVTLMGNGNYATISQSGGGGNHAGISAVPGLPNQPGVQNANENIFSITQTGFDNEAYLFPGAGFELRNSTFNSTQTGIENKISGTSFGGSIAPITMNGQNNSLDIKLTGDRNNATVGSYGFNNFGQTDVLGNDNRVHNLQGSDRGYAALNSRGTVFINGDGNEADISQITELSVIANNATITQTGNKNKALISQRDANGNNRNPSTHSASITQAGGEHDAMVVVSGTQYYGGDSAVTVTQGGVLNGANVALYGGGNEARIEQSGSNNLARIQGGHNDIGSPEAAALNSKFTVVQTGNRNTAGVIAKGRSEAVPGGITTYNYYDNTALIEQVGNENRAVSDPESPGAEAILLDGSENTLNIRQAGNLHIADVKIFGDKHTVAINTEGTYNRTKLHQAGTHHSGSISVNGEYNEASLMQEGADNTASIQQAGSTNTGSIQQNGTNNTATINQAGDNHKAGVVQNGSGNSATIVQK